MMKVSKIWITAAIVSVAAATGCLRKESDRIDRKQAFEVGAATRVGWVDTMEHYTPEDSEPMATDSNPLSIIYCDNMFGLSASIKSVKITTSAGAGVATVGGFTMGMLGGENKFIASSTAAVDLNKATGVLPKNYPFVITSVSFCDATGATVSSVSTNIKITQSGPFTIRIVE